MAMTPRERWLALLEHKTPDRIPTAYHATGEFTQRLLADLGLSGVEQLWPRLHIDQPAHVGPQSLRQAHPDDSQADMWGIRYQQTDYGTGSYAEAVFHPLAEAQTAADVHKHRWPSPDDFNYQSVTQGLEQADGTRVVYGGGYEPFLLYGYMRGLEAAFEDLLLNPEIAQAILGHLFDFHYEHNRRIYKAAAQAKRGKIDLTYVAEDLGSQTGPLIGLETYRRFLLPNQKKMADLARHYGIHVAYHTDGSARVFLPDLIDVVGIETLNPVQWRCPGMERQGLVRDFGKRIVFHGAMDNQQTLPFGTVEEVIAEVKDNIRIFKDARWICGPCHNIQNVTPTRNIVAMYEAIHELGKL